MNHVLVRYTVKAGHIEQVKGIVKNFVLSIKHHEPQTLMYKSLISDENEFFHFMQFEDDHAEDLHRNADHTKEFVDALYPLCVKQPEFVHMKLFASKKDPDPVMKCRFKSN